MAREATLGAGPTRTQAGSFCEFGFVVFLLLIFVTLRPFALRNMSILPLGDSGNGEANIWRQVCYLGTFALIALSSWQATGARMLQAVPATLAILLGWCFLSAAWAPAPDIAMRRAVLEIVIALSAMFAVTTIGSERAFTLLGYVLTGILLVNFASIALVHQAVHLGDETDRQLIGDWRGLYYHKNIAGAVTAITALLFAFRALETRQLLHWLVFAAAVAFTIMTRSKTSLALLPVALSAGLLFRYTRRDSLERWIVAATAASALTLAAIAITVDFHAIERFLTDPTELTGRVAIWRGELAFIRDHPLLGSGFGSFADTGQLSPLYNYVADKWVQGEAHGHNAYLQLCVTIGGIGFLLAMVAFLLRPLAIFARMERQEDVQFYAPLFAVFVFGILHNFAESDFLEGDGPAWIAFLLVLASIHGRPQPASQHIVAQTVQWTAP
ncbi:MAG: O-antigen ligase family protein [Alphaproteobacteria bacterium]|nr:O-antigen ligase family protein [Alphaproteobacteria bacterium]